MRTRSAVGLAGLVALLALAGLRGWSSRQPVLVLIVLDTVRADHLPPWGADPRAAPWIASLAADSAVFERAYSTSSWTAPATASVFTGLYPPQHGVTEGFRAQQRAAGVQIELEDPALQLRGLPAAPTLPEQLQRAGWRTLGVANNLNIGPELGFDRGFDAFVSGRDHSAEALADQVRRWMWLPSLRPTFVYLHLNDAHHPYHRRDPWYTPPADPGERDRARYASEIRYLDHVLSELASDLGWQRADIVLASDHGEAFGEHGDEGHVFSLYREVNQVALLVHAPGRAPAGRHRAAVSLIDVLPTVQQLAQLPPGEGPGRSLLSLAQEQPAEPRVLFAHRASPRMSADLWAILRGDHKLIDQHDDEASYTLFDLASDPGESIDLSAQQPELLAELSALLTTFQQHHGASGEGPEVTIEVDEALYRHLEALGYVD